MIGFLPGLPFMGKIKKLNNIPRKLSPRKLIHKGSVGIVNGMCVIYPQNSPGGWNIIGRTPLDIFSTRLKNPLKITPGNKVKFKKINKIEYKNYVK